MPDKNELALGSIRDRPDAHIERLITLVPGQFWRALCDAPDEQEQPRIVPAGRMHMIREVKDVDGLAHTVVLRGHPSESSAAGYHYLLKNFLELFEHIENYEPIREAEIALLQGEITQRQSELEKLNSDPSYTMTLLAAPQAEGDVESPLSEFDHEAGLPRSGVSAGTGIQLITQGDVSRVQRQVKNQQILAQARANLIQARAGALSNTVNLLAPFYTERADAMVAAASGAIKLVEQVQQGLHTLELYTGNDVEVLTIRKGESADASLPYALRQRLLYMDEESLISAEADGADFSDFGAFSEQLCENPNLLRRVMPEERCIVSMKFRRRSRDYHDPALDFTNNQINRQSFLLLRDGENLYAIFSPLTYIGRLFPSKDDGERPFRGIRGESITVDNIRYADARDAFEKIALMYRRLLIMLWGLHDRTDILGPLSVDERFGGHANLLSGEVQGELFDFIYDDEPGLLLGEDRPSFRDWARQKNALAQSGSRVLIRWNNVMSTRTAPSCFSEGYGARGYWEAQRYSPKEPWGMAILHRKGKDLIAKVKVSGYSHSTHSDREFEATVTLPDIQQLGYNSLLCLDDVTPEEVMYYIESRENREDYLDYIPLFMDVYRQALADEEEAAPLRAEIISSLKVGGIADVSQKGVVDIVRSAIRQYRVAHRWAPIPETGTADYKKHLAKILGQLWVMFGKGGARVEAVESLMAGEGRKPLRLVVTGRNHLIVYAAPLDSELETRLGEHVWVQRIRLQERKTKISILIRRWIVLPESSPDETVIHAWDEADNWVGKANTAHGLRYEKVNALYEQLAKNMIRFEAEMAPFKDDDAFDQALTTLYSDTLAASGDYVVMPGLSLPIGILKGRGEQRWDESSWVTNYYGLAISMNRWSQLWERSTESQRMKIEDTLDRIYRNPETAINGLRNRGTLGCLSIIRLDACIDTHKHEGIETLTCFRSDDMERQRRKLKRYELVWLPDMPAFRSVLDYLGPNMNDDQKAMMEDFLRIQDGTGIDDE